LCASRGLDSSRALRAVGVRGTESSTAAAAEVLLGRSRLVAGSAVRDSAPADGGSARVDRTLIVEVAAVTGTHDDVEDAADSPEAAKDDTPVTDSAEDEEASKEVDDTTTKRGNHTSEGSEHGGGLELEADKEKSKDHEVGRKHTDGEVGSVVVVLHTTLEGISERLIIRISVRSDQGQDTVDEKHAGKNDGKNGKANAKNTASLGLRSANAPLFNKHVWCCSRHSSLLISSKQKQRKKHKQEKLKKKPQ